MKLLKNLLTSGVAAFGLLAASASMAVPTTWVDVQSPYSYVYSGGSVSYTHEILSDGFDPGIDTVQTFDLWISLFDDLDLSQETAQISLSNVAVGQTSSTFFNLLLPDYVSEGSVAASALAQLNEFGLLSVTVSSLFGDFFVGNSVLVANGNSGGAVAVPEPGTLGMLGLGLLGVALVARRRNRANKRD